MGRHVDLADSDDPESEPADAPGAGLEKLAWSVKNHSLPASRNGIAGTVRAAAIIERTLIPSHGGFVFLLHLFNPRRPPSRNLFRQLHLPNRLQRVPVGPVSDKTHTTFPTRTGANACGCCGALGGICSPRFPLQSFMQIPTPKSKIFRTGLTLQLCLRDQPLAALGIERIIEMMWNLIGSLYPLHRGISGGAQSVVALGKRCVPPARGRLEALASEGDPTNALAICFRPIKMRFRSSFSVQPMMSNSPIATLVLNCKRTIC